MTTTAPPQAVRAPSLVDSRNRPNGEEVVAGIDIGGTNIKVILVTPSLDILGRVTVPTPARDGGDAIISQALSALASLRKLHPQPLRGVGVGAAGLVDATSGTITTTGNSFTGWAGYEVTAAITSALGVPATLDNDVNAFLLGEIAAGAVGSEENVFAMTLGTGLGGAVVLNGSLFSGTQGAAGEIGHVPGFGDALCPCGQRGHLETIAGGRGMQERYGERTGKRVEVHEIADAARSGDNAAIDVFQRAGWGLARAALIVAGTLDVTSVVIGGGITRSWDLLQPSLTAAIEFEPPVSGATIRVHRSQLGSDAVAFGAAAQHLRLLS